MRNSVISIMELFTFDREIDFHFIRYNLQLFVTIMFFISLIFIVIKKLWKQKVFIFFLIFTVLSAIMLTSLFPWYYVPDFLQTLQFPWRLAIYVAFGAIVVAGICLKPFENKKYFNVICTILLVFTLMGTYINIDHLEESQIDLNNLNNAKSMGNQLEYLPEKTLNNKDYFYNRTDEIIITQGSAQITTTFDDVPDMAFDVKTNETITIELPRLYYMGYKLEVDGQDIELTESDYGFLQATISQSGTYKLTYEGTFVMKIANWISLITLIGVIIAIIKNHKKVLLLEEKIINLSVS